MIIVSLSSERYIAFLYRVNGNLETVDAVDSGIEWSRWAFCRNFKTGLKSASLASMFQFAQIGLRLSLNIPIMEHFHGALTSRLYFKKGKPIGK